MPLARLGTFLVRLFLLAGVAAGEIATAAEPYFNSTFPDSASGISSGWTKVNAFPGLTFTDPLWIAEVPGGGDMLVLEKAGKIWRFPNSPEVTPAGRVLALDLGDRLQVAPELGLLRLVFHPQFGQAGSAHANEVFLCYSHRPPGTAASIRSMWRISRFQWQPATGTIDPASEEVLIQQYDHGDWHNAGAMSFDNQGFLLITCGDGGAGNDSMRLAQKLDLGLFSGVLRIDVDKDPARSHPIRRQPLDPAGKPADYPASFTQGYGIPNDNPWLDPAGSVLEEFYALGLRSPHSAHYDAVAGEFWVADVGQAQQEELDLIQKGRNYGWSYAEGTSFGPVAKPANVVGTDTLPVYSYSHQVGGCIIGGLRYRGAKWASELGGKILIGDNVKATLSSVTLNPPGTPQVTKLVSGLGGSIYTGLANICTDSAGEVYLLVLNGTGQDGGRILKLAGAGAVAEPPELLSQTGLFSSISPLYPSADLIPFEVASPLWSDGAEKKRWIVKPGNSKLALQSGGAFNFPAGTILVKHFEIATDKRNPASLRRLETRVMVSTPGNQKYGLTYKWNAAGTDAVLLKDGLEEDFPVTDENGTQRLQRWSYPSREDCMSCHVPATGVALGFRLNQLNRMVTPAFASQPVNQLTWLSSDKSLISNGSFSDKVALAGYLRSAGLEDSSMPLEHRVRSYLDANCGHCHRSDSGTPYFDARLEVPPIQQNLIDGVLAGHFEMGPGARYIKPGNPELSAVHVRAASAEPGVAMPPLGKHVVDEKAMSLLREYIQRLNPADYTTPPASRPLRPTFVAPAEARAKFVANVIFDGNVSDLDSSDFTVQGGTVTNFSGSGYFYAIEVTPATPGITGPVIISLASNRVNTAGAGNLPASVSVLNIDNVAPVLTFGTSIPKGDGIYEVLLTASESIVGLDLSDFTATDGRILAISGSGASYLITFAVDRFTSGTLVTKTSITDAAGNPASPKSRSFAAFRQFPFKDALSLVVKGFVQVWGADYYGRQVQEGQRGGATGVDAALSITYTFDVPVAGSYFIRGLTRADDTGSDSFYVATGAQPTPLVWTTNTGLGEIGSGLYHWSTANNAGVVHQFQFSAGVNTVIVYAREDGTLLGPLEVLPLNPFPMWWSNAAVEVANAPFTVSLTFSSPVTGLETGDFMVSGGRVTGLQGSGADYQVTVLPEGREITLSLPANRASGQNGQNSASYPWRFLRTMRYADWAGAAGVDASPSSQLADGDGDGLPQLIEYAFGTDPQQSFSAGTAAGRLPLLSVSRVGEVRQLVLSYFRRRDDSTLLYTPQFSGDAVVWGDSTAAPEIRLIDALWEEVTIRETSTATKRFGRVKVELVAP